MATWSSPSPTPALAINSIGVVEDIIMPNEVVHLRPSDYELEFYDSGCNTANFNVGIRRDLDHRLERGLITQEQYRERIQSLLPPSDETPQIEDRRLN